jgi:hypothetical protein
MAGTGGAPRGRRPAVLVASGIAAALILVMGLLSLFGPPTLNVFALFSDNQANPDNTFATGTWESPSLIATGSYTGANPGGHTVTGLGFKPDLVIVKSITGVSGVIRTSSMPGTMSKDFIQNNLESNLITSLNADGFTVGSDNRVDANATTYRWVAISEGDALDVGSYVGTGVAHTVPIGFQPEWLITLGGQINGVGAGEANAFRPRPLGASTNSFLFTTGNPQGNRLTGLSGSGFSVGTDNDVNQLNRTYYYAAWKPKEGTVQAGQYTGNSTADREIATGFMPGLAWVKRANQGNSWWRSFSMPGAAAAGFQATAATTNRVTEMTTNGFRVGTNGEVNTNNQTYYYLAHKQEGDPPESRIASGSYAGSGGTQSITGLGFTPDVVLVKARGTAEPGVMRTSTMPTTQSKPLNSTGSLQPNRVTSLDADGFTVGNHQSVNQNGQAYEWVAFSAGDALSVGTYTGNNAANRTITTGFQPVWVTTLPEGRPSYFKPQTAGAAAWRYTSGTAENGIIEAMTTDGFRISNNTNINVNGVNFHWVAWKPNAKVFQSSYTPPNNGISGGAVTAPGFAPVWAWVQRGSTSVGRWRSSTLTVTDALGFNNVNALSNCLTALTPTGFNTGTDESCRQNGSTYHYLVQRDAP